MNWTEFAAVSILAFCAGSYLTSVGYRRRRESPEAKRVRAQLAQREKLLGIANLWKGVELDQGGALLRAAARIVEHKEFVLGGPPEYVDALDDLEVAYYGVPREFREKAANGESVPRPSMERRTLIEALQAHVRPGFALGFDREGFLTLDPFARWTTQPDERVRHDGFDPLTVNEWKRVGEWIAAPSEPPAGTFDGTGQRRNEGVARARRMVGLLAEGTFAVVRVR